PGIKKGFGSAVLGRITTAFSPTEEISAGNVTSDTTNTEIASHQEDFFFGKKRQILAPRLADQKSKHETKHDNAIRLVRCHQGGSLWETSWATLGQRPLAHTRCPGRRPSGLCRSVGCEPGAWYSRCADPVK